MTVVMTCVIMTAVQMLITYKCKVAHTDAKCGAISFYDRLQIVHL